MRFKPHTTLNPLSLRGSSVPPIPHAPRASPAHVPALLSQWVMVVSKKAKKIFFPLQNAFELLFEDVKPLLDVFEVLATGENDLS